VENAVTDGAPEDMSEGMAEGEDSSEEDKMMKMAEESDKENYS
jgi:hypothetical protein